MEPTCNEVAILAVPVGSAKPGGRDWRIHLCDFGTWNGTGYRPYRFITNPLIRAAEYDHIERLGKLGQRCASYTDKPESE